MKENAVLELTKDKPRDYREEYLTSKSVYEKQLEAVLSDPRTQQGESYYPSAQSDLEGPSGYFEPHGKNSFYELDNPYPPNDEESVPIDDFKSRALEDRKKWQLVFLDLMGAGAGVGIADHVFSANLIDGESTPEHTHIKGDCLSEEGRDRVLHAVEEYLRTHKDDARPAILHTVFWRPIRAMTYFRHNLYALEQIYAELRELYAMQHAGGRIYFQAPSDEWLDLFEHVLRDAKKTSILQRHPTGSLMTRLIKQDRVPLLPEMNSKEIKEALLTMCRK